MSVGLVFGLLTLLGAAQAPVMPPTCDGDMVIVRLSSVKPGALEKFVAATKAHEGWYRTNGITTNRVIIGRVATRNATTNTMVTSDSEVLTFHLRPPARPANAGDEAWKAYVQAYQDVSTITSEHAACFPKGTFQ